MVQVLPYVPSFGEKLVPVLAQAGSDVAEGIQTRRARSALDKLLNPQPMPQVSDPLNPSPMAGVAAAPQQQGLQPSKVMQLYSLAEKGYGKEQAKILANSYVEQQKLAGKEGAEIRKEERSTERKLQETEQVPFFDKVAKDRETLPSAIQANDQVIDAIMNGKVGPTSLANVSRIAQDLGVPKSITNMLESPDSKEFNNGIKGLMGHTIKDTFRGTTTQREINIAEAMQAEIGVKPEANLAAAWAVQSDLMLRQEQLRLYDDLVAQGVPRGKIPAVVNKQIEPYRKQLKEQYFEAIDELRKK